MLRIDCEELEMKNDNLEAEKIDVDDSIEELYKQISHLKKKEGILIKLKLNTLRTENVWFD